MNNAQAVEAALAGKRLTAPILSKGFVLKAGQDWQSGKPIVLTVNEATGDSSEFAPELYPECQDWREVTGWANYGA